MRQTISLKFPPTLTVFSTKWLTHALVFCCLVRQGMGYALHAGAEEGRGLPSLATHPIPSDRSLPSLSSEDLPTPWPMPSTAKPGTTLPCLQKNEGVSPSIWRWGGGRLLFSKGDTSLFSCTRIMFRLAKLAPHLSSIPQANNTIKQMERRFSNNKFHRTGHSSVGSFKRSQAFRRINPP